MDDFEVDADNLKGLEAEIKSAVASEGVLLSIRDEVRAITASADGGVWRVVVFMLPAGYLGWFGQLLAKKTHSAAGSLIRRLREKHKLDLVVGDGTIRVLIEPDLPQEAIAQLDGPLPEAPSGELRYDRVAQEWVDSEGETS